MEEYCTHIAIMSAGRMLRLGTVQEIAQGAASSRCRYTVLLARPFADAKGAADSITGVTNTTVESEKLILEFESGRDAACKLLGELTASQSSRRRVQSKRRQSRGGLPPRADPTSR